MPTNVIMPQMGESIAEGTLTKWLKKPGDAVKRDEPLFEISTDKVDAEIPAPASGTLLEILVPEGQTVPINTVVARLGEAGEQALRRRRAGGGKEDSPKRSAELPAARPRCARPPPRLPNPDLAAKTHRRGMWRAGRRSTAAPRRSAGPRAF